MLLDMTNDLQVACRLHPRLHGVTGLQSPLLSRSYPGSSASLCLSTQSYVHKEPVLHSIRSSRGSVFIAQHNQRYSSYSINSKQSLCPLYSPNCRNGYSSIEPKC